MATGSPNPHGDARASLDGSGLDRRDPSDAAADALTALSAYLGSLQKLLDQSELDRPELKRCLGFAKSAFGRVVELYEADFRARQAGSGSPPAGPDAAPGQGQA